MAATWRREIRLLIFGSRSWTDKDCIRKAFKKFKNVECVISGTANGADRLAEELAEELDIPVVRYPADWAQYGKRAGPIRNQQMIDEGMPDFAMGFWDGYSRGSLDMINRLTAANVPHTVIKSSQW